MGMDLSGVGGYFRWTNSGWTGILKLAEKHGWEPLGVGPPRNFPKAEWSGGTYFSNDGQRVYARDAYGIADALEKALTHFSKAKPSIRKSTRSRNWFATEEGQKAVRQFIRYCRKGSFRIY